MQFFKTLFTFLFLLRAFLSRTSVILMNNVEVSPFNIRVKFSVWLLIVGCKAMLNIRHYFPGKSFHPQSKLSKVVYIKAKRISAHFP